LLPEPKSTRVKYGIGKTQIKTKGWELGHCPADHGASLRLRRLLAGGMDAYCLCDRRRVSRFSGHFARALANKASARKPTILSTGITGLSPSSGELLQAEGASGGRSGRCQPLHAALKLVLSHQKRRAGKNGAAHCGSLALGLFGSLSGSGKPRRPIRELVPGQGGSPISARSKPTRTSFSGSPQRPALQ
jgi:hypothetical protein